MRRYIYRNRYIQMRELTIKLQCIARAKMAAAQLQKLREEKAAIKIQTEWRRYSARKAYIAKHQFVVQIQAAVRARAARKRLAHAREEHAAVQIQRLIRGW